MALSYPLDMPLSTKAKGTRKITWRAVNGVGYNSSPFNMQESVFDWNAQVWQADVTVAPQTRLSAEYWVAFMLSLRGRAGTFLLPDPLAIAPRGSVSALNITGTTGASSVTVVSQTGTIWAGDSFQLGAGSSARLHKVLEQRSAGSSGPLEIWPSLRNDYTNQAVILNNPVGVFRLTNNIIGWDIDEASVYGISFTAQEALP
jgi:hypothetical protein